MSNLARIVYTPEGGSKRTWTVDMDNPAWDLTYGTETATGWPWGEFGMKLSMGSVVALRAMIWVLRKRDEPKLAIDSVQVLFNEVDIEDVEDPAGAAPEAVEDPKEAQAS